MVRLLESTGIILAAITAVEAFVVVNHLPHSHHHHTTSILPNDNINHQREFFKSVPSSGRSLCVLKDTATTTTTLLDSDALNGIVLVIFALIIGVAAQSFINNMLGGDRGLGAFLKDGRGYNNSAFKPLSEKEERENKKDPLPWLSLPQFDFVEVAGQEDNKMALNNEDIEIRLEQLRVEMNTQLEKGNVQKATKIRDELEELMKENGFEYSPTSSANSPQK